jgi:hypothetical protein
LAKVGALSALASIIDVAVEMNGLTTAPNVARNMHADSFGKTLSARIALDVPARILLIFRGPSSNISRDKRDLSRLSEWAFPDSSTGEKEWS